MPHYDFIYRNCQKRFSRFLGITAYEKEKKTLKCPRCGSNKNERRWASFYTITSKKS